MYLRNTATKALIDALCHQRGESRWADRVLPELLHSGGIPTGERPTAMKIPYHRVP